MTRIAVMAMDFYLTMNFTGLELRSPELNYADGKIEGNFEK